MRKVRQVSTLGIYHVIARGLNKQNIFESREDFARLFNCIKKYREICKFNLISYVFMNNHIHLIIEIHNTESTEPLSKLMQRILCSYATYYSLKYGRSGGLFERHFTSIPINDSKYLKAAVNYIHKNPLDIDGIRMPEDYTWCSYRGYLNENDEIVNTSYLLSLFNKDELIIYDTQISENERNEFEQDLVKHISDIKAVKLIKQIAQVDHPYEITQMPRGKRDYVILKILSFMGIKMKQMARILGLSYTVIIQIVNRFSYKPFKNRYRPFPGELFSFLY